jgi:hypothetical protein
LFTTSRRGVEPNTDGCVEAYSGGSCFHLNRVDPSTGAVLAEVGSVGVTFLADIDFADGVLYGSAFLNLTGTRGGGALTIDPSTAAGTWIDGVQGYGTSPFANRELQNGALAVHPVTGDMWGIESNFAATVAMFRIDPATGHNDVASTVRLGLNGTAVPFGFDGLVILPDGQFIATRGGPPGPNGEVLYEIDPVPDLATLLAPVTLIPLTFDTPLAGSINGLDIVPGGMSVNLELTCPVSVQRGDTAEAGRHPVP